MGRTPWLLHGCPACALCADGGGTATNPVHADLRRRTSLGAAVWYRPDGALHGSHGSFRCRWHAPGCKAGGPVSRSVAAGWDAPPVPTFPEASSNVTLQTAPSRRDELIGWAGFLLLVAMVFRLRRVLDRR